MFEMLRELSIRIYFVMKPLRGLMNFGDSEWFDFPKDKLYMTYYPDDKDSYNRVALVWSETVSKTTGKSVQGLLDQIQKSSLTVEKPLTWKYPGLHLLAEDIETTVTSEFGTLSCHNLTLTLLFLSSEYKELPLERVQEQVWNVW